MTDEQLDANSAPASPESSDPDEARIEALKAQMEVVTAAVNRGIADHQTVDYVMQMIGAISLGTFSTAFVQALGKHAADGSVKRVSDLVQTHVRKKGKPDETRITVDDGSAATIAITENTPDEARLALLDLDVTAGELRGKLLRWDSAASAWRPDPDK